MTHREASRTSLLEVGARLARADAERQAVLADLTEVARVAQRAEITITEIARLSGASRPTIYALLAKGAPTS